jgi:hypothetical protein
MKRLQILLFFRYFCRNIILDSGGTIMAFDGVVIANIVYDMNRLLTGGRIYKIYQPEADELLLVVKNNKETYRLLISAGKDAEGSDRTGDHKKCGYRRI